MNKTTLRRPTKERIEAMKNDLLSDLWLLRQLVEQITGSEEHRNSELARSLGEAMTQVETFAAISLQVMSETNQSKLREAMRLVEIRFRMGVPPLAYQEQPAAAQPQEETAA